MKASFEFIENGDIVWYARVQEESNIANNCLSNFFNKYYPFVGKFKVTNLEYITSYTRNISDYYHEPEYEVFPCNKISFKIEPVDDAALQIKKIVLNQNPSLYSFDKPIVVDFTHKTEPVENTDGHGTCHNLFLSRKMAINDCMEYINKRLTTDYQLGKIIESKEHNEKELEALTQFYNTNEYE